MVLEEHFFFCYDLGEIRASYFDAKQNSMTKREHKWSNYMNLCIKANSLCVITRISYRNYSSLRSGFIR